MKVNYIILCCICKTILKSELESQYTNLTLTNNDMAKHLKQCKSQFLDVDNEVKSCFQAYIEQLILKYKYVLTPPQPERSKREDSDKCIKCFSERIYKINTITIEDVGKVLDLSLMRCSEHCGNTVRDK